MIGVLLAGITLLTVRQSFFYRGRGGRGVFPALRGYFSDRTSPACAADDWPLTARHILDRAGAPRHGRPDRGRLPNLQQLDRNAAVLHPGRFDGHLRGDLDYRLADL